MEAKQGKRRRVRSLSREKDESEVQEGKTLPDHCLLLYLIGCGPPLLHPCTPRVLPYVGERATIGKTEDRRPMICSTLRLRLIHAILLMHGAYQTITSRALQLDIFRHRSRWARGPSGT